MFWFPFVTRDGRVAGIASVSAKGVPSRAVALAVVEVPVELSEWEGLVRRLPDETVAARQLVQERGGACVFRPFPVGEATWVVTSMVGEA